MTSLEPETIEKIHMLLHEQEDGYVGQGFAIIDPDFVHEDEDPNQPGFMGFVLRTFGRKGVRVTWALGALLIGSIWLNTRADVSAETEVSDVTCGSPGTNSYLDSEGFCDCKAGYTWVDESDPNSVHCVAVK